MKRERYKFFFALFMIVALTCLMVGYDHSESWKHSRFLGVIFAAVYGWDARKHWTLWRQLRHRIDDSSQDTLGRPIIKVRRIP